MRKLVLLAGVSLSAIAMSANAALADYTLNILHLNDWHSRIEPINGFGSTCGEKDASEGKCFGGAARLKTAVDQRRKALEGENVLFMNAGDNFQGSLFYTTYKGDAEAEFLSLMGTDVMAVGNHEFDDGEEGLAAFLDKVSFPVLGANILAGASSKIGDRVKPYTVMEAGGEKIGVIGVIANDTAELSSPGGNVLIADDISAARDAAAALTEAGVNKIVLLSHVGLERDKQIAEAVDGIDVIVGGHSHTLLSNTEEGAPPYPSLLLGPGGNLVAIVQAGSNSKHLGEIRVVFNDNGEVVSTSGEPLLLDNSIAEDPAVVARVQELGAPIEELKNRRVGETTAAIDGSRDNCRARECAMGNLVTDAMLARVKNQGIQVAIQNGGGLRASIDAGDITMGEVLTVLPFQNTLATFQLTGADIVASLESGVSQIEEGKGRFPQVAGLRYTFDTSVAPNEGRISGVQVSENGQWAPIDTARTYGVVTNDFMRRGGDGYKLFESNGQNAYDYGPGLELVLAEYLAGNQPYQPGELGSRITEAAMMAKEEPKAEMAKEEEAAVKTPAKEEPKAEAATAAKMEMKAEIYQIRKGDNFWDLSRKFYGDARMWNKLAEANPGYNKNRLKIGAPLNVPPAN